MILGAVTYNMLKDWDLETIVNKLPELGFEAVELRTTHAHGVEPTIGPEERERVRKLFAGSKLKLVGYGTVCEFHSPDAAERARQVETGKAFIDLAKGTGALGIKVRPNNLPDEVPRETTIANIAACLKELGYYGEGRGIEVWLEVHGRETMNPPVIAEIMKLTDHPSVGVCWNSNGQSDMVDGSISTYFKLLRPWLKSCHINELVNGYPYRELFTLLRETGYDRWTLMEAQENPQTERFMKYYQALWRELNRS